jgi:hypothetical protein
MRHNSFMPSPSLYRRHRFPAEIISHCVWLYFRFALSFRSDLKVAPESCHDYFEEQTVKGQILLNAPLVTGHDLEQSNSVELR